jgi:hypothetical protein
MPLHIVLPPACSFSRRQDPLWMAVEYVALSVCVWAFLVIPHYLSSTLGVLGMNKGYIVAEKVRGQGVSSRRTNPQHLFMGDWLH